MSDMPPAPKPSLYRQISDVLQPLGLIEDTLGLLKNGLRPEIDVQYLEQIGGAARAIRDQVQSLLTRVYDEAHAGDEVSQAVPS